jgi:anaerobic ribonucleoside-triphosphate reductase activating protein
MLKYLYKSVVFQEVPGETSLALAISGCQVRCVGCHSRELWEDKGIPLTVEEVEHLLK